MSEKIKLRITAKEDNCRKYAVMFMGIKVAVAFDRDSGAKVGYEARMISGKIGSGGSSKNWYCYVNQDSVFEIEIEEEIYQKNKNKIKKWEMQEIKDFSMTKEHADKLVFASDNLE